MTTLSYHGNVAEKKATLKQLRLHQKLDQIIQGTYWEGNGDGKGCAVGCLTHDPSGGHALFPDKWGVPTNIAYLIDAIFESLTVEESKGWPVRFMSAIPVGVDLSGTWDKFSVWMLRYLLAHMPSDIPRTKAAVEVMAVLFERAVQGDEPSESDWTDAAYAAYAARAADAAYAAYAARAADAAYAARAAYAADAAYAARAAYAAYAAYAARAAERNKWAREAANELVRIVKATKP